MLGLKHTLASSLTKMFKGVADCFFKQRYGHRAVVLETVAGVPGMIAGMFAHLRSLRHGESTTTPDIHEMLSEAENERMHLMMVLAVVQPTVLERFIIAVAQFVFWHIYLALYLLSPSTAHLMISMFEEEAVNSYTNYIGLIRQGHLPNPQAPKIAVDYYGLPSEALWVDVLEKIRLDEQHHCDANRRIAVQL